MAVEIEIHKKFGDFNLDFQLNSNSRRIGILGESGCGKSMALKSIAGVEVMDTGRIAIEDRILFDSSKKVNVKPQKRQIGYLFQNYALFPSMTVKGNIMAGIKASPKDKEEKARNLIRKFQLMGLEDHYPSELSGGQQQRTALARALAPNPNMIMLDEPFSALDSNLRDRMQQELLNVLSDYKGIVILVSHSRDEIYRFSDELFVMQKGHIIRNGNVKDVFEHPVCREVARLTGCKNIVKSIKKDARNLFVPEWKITLHFSNEIMDDVAYVGIRAHDFIPIWGEKEENCIPVNVNSVAELPFERKYYLKVEDGSEDICWFVQRNMLQMLAEKGMPSYLKLPEESILLLTEK